MNRNLITWQVSQLPQCPHTAHFTLSSVKLSLSLRKFAYFHAVWNEHIKYFKLPKSVCVLLTINLFCLFSCYFILLLTLFREVLKPNRCTTIKMESCVCESLSVRIQSWTTSFYCISECTWRAGAWTAQLTDDCHRRDTSQAVQSRKLWSYNAENTEFQDLCPLENASN
jgi:hypothetical protein